MRTVKGFDILELLKILGLPGVVIVAWIYDAVMGNGVVHPQTWVLILILAISVSFITQWQSKSKDRVAASSSLQEDHRTLAEHLEAQTRVLLEIETTLAGQVPTRGLLTLTPVVLSDLKWVFETTIRNALSGPNAMAMISESLLTRSMEMVAASKAADLMALSPIFKSKSVVSDLNQTITKIVHDLYDKFRSSRSELSAMDLQFVWELVDTHVNTFGNTLLSKIQQDLADMDEGLRHLVIGNVQLHHVGDSSPIQE